MILGEWSLRGGSKGERGKNPSKKGCHCRNSVQGKGTGQGQEHWAVGLDKEEIHCFLRAKCSHQPVGVCLYW